jgi:hypothetical protein
VTIPVVAARTTTADPSITRSHSIGLGSPNAGDLLVVFAGSSGATTAPFLIDENVSGKLWTPIGAQAVSSNLRFGVYAKLAVGSGTDALTLVTAGSGRMASHCYRVTGHGSTVAGGSTATANSTNGNPPAASITGAAQDTLFLTAMTTTTSVASAAPASYGTLTTSNAGQAFTSSAERGISATTTDDPGTFTNTSQEWIATTVAIPELAITTNARATQAAREILSNVTAAMRASQIVREIASSAAPNLRVSQIVVEMVSVNVPNDSGGGPSMIIIAT